MSTPKRPKTYATEEEIPTNQRYRYRQAPGGKYGTEWWPVSPFSGNTWERFAPAEPDEPEALPEGFEAVFGPKPTRETHPDYHEHRLALMDWNDALRDFKSAGVPGGLFTDEALNEANVVFIQYGMGPAAFWEDRHGGWAVRWPSQVALPGFELRPGVINSPHNAVAKYQIRLLQAGGFPESIHYLVPPGLYTPTD